ncbi:MAG: CPBP family intramembrane glutamic endopeptidase, partial [Bacteroidota bacterium]
ALFEEVLFRSGFQQVFIGWTNNKWAGILIASIVFSSFHFSYFGFLPRMALGVILGLIFYYSKNIWLSILLHFLNNAFVITQLYIASGMGKSISKTMDESIPSWWGIIAVVLLLVFFRSFKKESDLVLVNREKNLNPVY